MKKSGILFAIMPTTWALSAQNEVALRSDGIVVPRTAPSAVIGPRKGFNDTS